MKKKIIGFVMFAAIAVAAGWNVYQNESKISLSDIGQANVDALAAGESSNNNQNPCKWKHVSCGFFSGSREVCLTDGDGNTCPCGYVSRDC
ncbi:hypothetical protein M2480_002144 [Parabacteroides sp. PFB2-12]|uniref:NVEALA domain-containing protein n=1 Tax=unclassified Parabacteroides TaxID=2649774 RepID=UPI0024732C54|nr:MULTISPECIES: NVEALA domain-containing protein [unclassified Parabacteroides]MDH6342162.1 hypothetical protein [Parabacteroides sp. PM6-13]MDH6391154.1 hypothetical protein [Parabacteroides sp. PFB2-12]MDL2310189.1 NVEALA domain-containing protein [Parabacteroides sp. OttesenSCG-928-B22]